ncbi:hypothetical protein [Fimbriimonas ginsengisoli]|uniref:Uncharacterized protein n=1 Tax=Fimbriimonas ginsengisoli Gsoil 348 TaxID=661478 RepID=A0A068NND5_FIMGI|nr:hypothetical protein [Fimbriimonas ginsengisoli]AIE84922.1 hypothetical protein OP10G_1554 [Fimbriimonas ginsengisoli Gsoil 348]
MTDSTRIETGFIEWLRESDWQNAYAEFLLEFFSEFAELTGQDVFQVIPSLPEEVAAEALACALDQFATESYEEFTGKKETPIDAFLFECGDQYETAEVDYLVALRSSKPDLYDVVELDEESVVLKSLLDPAAATVKVAEPLGMSPDPGDAVFARVIEEGDIRRFTQGVVVLSSQSRTEVVEMFEAAVKDYLKELPKLIRKDPQQLRAARSAVRQGLSAIVVALWIDEMDTTFDTSGILKYAYQILVPVPEIEEALDRVMERSPEPGVQAWAAINDTQMLAVVTIEEEMLLFAVPDEDTATIIHERLQNLLGDRIGEQVALADFEDEDDDLPAE